MNPLSLIAAFHNWLADKDFLWWPFSFLRPSKETRMTNSHVLMMSVCFGGLTFLMFTAFAVINNMFTLELAFLTLIGGPPSFALWFWCITKPLWNVRARELQQKK